MGTIADNSQVNSGTGDVIRDKDRSGVKTQIVGIDLGIGGSETLMNGSMPVSIASGSGRVGPQTSSTGTITSVSSTVTANTTLLASNANRLGATVFNESTSILYVSYGATCGPTLTPTTYTVQVAPGGFYNLSDSSVIYTGLITCTWSAANGSARVTELS